MVLLVAVAVVAMVVRRKECDCICQSHKNWTKGTQRDLPHFSRVRKLSPGFHTDEHGVHCVVNDVTKVQEEHKRWNSIYSTFKITVKPHQQ